MTNGWVGRPGKSIQKSVRSGLILSRLGSNGARHITMKRSSLVFLCCLAVCGCSRRLDRYDHDFPTPPPPGSLTVIFAHACELEWGHYFRLAANGTLLDSHSDVGADSVARWSAYMREAGAPAVLVYIEPLPGVKIPGPALGKVLQTLASGSDSVMPIVVYVVLPDEPQSTLADNLLVPGQTTKGCQG